VIAGVIAQNEGKLAVIRAPLQGFRDTPGNAAFGENLFNAGDLRRSLGEGDDGK
jgi:hypothetical protein